MLKGELFRRVFAHIWLKTLGSTLVISVFFVAYFYVLHNPLGTPRTMPVLALEGWIPVVPSSAWLYFSLWVYICLPSSLMRTRSALGHYLFGAFLLSTLGLSLFLFFPTQVPAFEVDWQQYPTLQFLKQSDTSGNACPSLHVAFAVFSGLWLHVVLRHLQVGRLWCWGNGLWCGAIIASTLTTRQHVLIDLICGAILGAFVFALNYRRARRRELEL